MNAKIKKDIYSDIVIIGAGPVGLAFACGFANSKIKITIVDKISKKKLLNPDVDGREIALTHNSVNLLKKIKVWSQIPNKSISKIKEARVLDGISTYFLNFNYSEIQKECLGYIIPNYLIKKYLFKKLNKIPNVNLINEVECLSINTENEKYSTVVLSNGKKMKTSIVVAADSRFSTIRKKMGISAFIHDFDKNMIVCRMSHEKPHNNIAYEYFRYNQTQALLPYINKQSSIVTTASKDQTSDLMKINKKNFNKKMQNNFNFSFGKMKLVGKRYCYPMITTYSKNFIGPRFALIGDAAVGMHPVTAHGFNLNLQGVEILINEINLAIKDKRDIGLQDILRRYQFKLRKIATPLYLTTNGIVSLYTNSLFPAKVARQVFLRMVNLIKPVKKTFLHVLR